jgi:hypothetical protein
MQALELLLRVPRRHLRDLTMEAECRATGLILGLVPLGAAERKPIATADGLAPVFEVLPDVNQVIALLQACGPSRWRLE